MNNFIDDVKKILSSFMADADVKDIMEIIEKHRPEADEIQKLSDQFIKTIETDLMNKLHSKTNDTEAVKAYYIGKSGVRLIESDSTSKFIIENGTATDLANDIADDLQSDDKELRNKALDTHFQIMKRGLI